MSGMMLITLFLIGKLKCFNGNGQLWKLIISCIPLMFGFYVGITRIQDNRHHPTDVIAGYLIGSGVAIIVYLYYYPLPFKRSGTELPLYYTSENDALRNNHVPPIPDDSLSNGEDGDLEELGQSSSISRGIN